MEAQIRIEKQVAENRAIRAVFGGWWWCVGIPNHPYAATGFARSEQQARRRAERAARRLATGPADIIYPHEVP